jgi:hypothetical protein
MSKASSKAEPNLESNHAGVCICCLTFFPYGIKALAVVFGCHDEQVRLVSASQGGTHQALVGVQQSCTNAMVVVTSL